MGGAPHRHPAAQRPENGFPGLLYLTLKEEILYDLLGTLRGLTGGDRRLYLPGGVMNQVYDTKNRVIKA